jgi:hypothetical protein
MKGCLDILYNDIQHNGSRMMGKNCIFLHFLKNYIEFDYAECLC